MGEKLLNVNRGNKMKKIILIILFNSVLCMADQRHFVWTYEYKTVNRGDVEFEHYYTTSHPNSSDLSYGPITTGHQMELEIGMNERFDFAIYHQFEQQTNLQYKGYKLRGRYRIGEKNMYLLDPVLYMEYHGKPDFSEHGIETKLILAKETDKLIASLNPILEIEIENDEKEIKTEYAAGITYKFNKLIHAGIEFKGSKDGHYLGPTISHGLNSHWFSLGTAIAIGKIKEGKPEIEIRMIMGVGLK